MSKFNGTSLCLFGSYPVRVNGQPYYLGISGPTEQLFQYLLVNSGKETRREFLAELFWRGSTTGRQRSALNSAICRIKRQLTDVEGVEVVCDGPAVFLSIADTVRVDFKELTETVHAVSLSESMSTALADRLYKALDACDAPFLDGVTSDWVLTERERLFNIQIRGMTILMHWLGQQRRYEDALDIGRRLLAADPARETIQCEMMWLYVLNGQRAQAVRQFQDYRSWLRVELDIEPMPETRALYDHIRLELNDGRSGRRHQVSGIAEKEPRRASFNLLLGAIERSRRELYKMLSDQLL
ncbi:MAG: bacterial transcriptional activator domain-containing protein [Lysobacterales bacterium]